MARAHRFFPLSLISLTAALIGCPVAEPTPLPAAPELRDGRWAMEISDAHAWGDCDGVEPMAMGAALIAMDLRHNARGRVIIEAEGIVLRGEQSGSALFAEGSVGGDDDHPEPTPYEADGRGSMPGDEDCGCDCDCWTEPVEPMPEPCGDAEPGVEDDEGASADSDDEPMGCGVSEPGDPGRAEPPEPSDCDCGCGCVEPGPTAFVTLEAELRHAEAFEGVLRVELAGPRTSCLVEADVVAAFLTDGRAFDGEDRGDGDDVTIAAEEAPTAVSGG